MHQKLMLICYNGALTVCFKWRSSYAKAWTSTQGALLLCFLYVYVTCPLLLSPTLPLHLCPYPSFFYFCSVHPPPPSPPPLPPAAGTTASSNAGAMNSLTSLGTLQGLAGATVGLNNINALAGSVNSEYSPCHQPLHLHFWSYTTNGDITTAKPVSQCRET